MNVTLEIAKVVATAVGGELGKNVFVGRLPASKSQDGMVAVAANGGEYDGGNLGNTKLTTELTITVVKADAAELYELELVDQKRAVEAYETAAGWYENDNAEAYVGSEFLLGSDKTNSNAALRTSCTSR